MSAKLGRIADKAENRESPHHVTPGLSGDGDLSTPGHVMPEKTEPGRRVELSAVTILPSTHPRDAALSGDP